MQIDMKKQNKYELSFNAAQLLCFIYNIVQETMIYNWSMPILINIKAFQSEFDKCCQDCQQIKANVTAIKLCLLLLLSKRKENVWSPKQAKASPQSNLTFIIGIYKFRLFQPTYLILVGSMYIIIHSYSNHKIKAMTYY